MVQNSGTTLRPGAYKPVNLPQKARVEEDSSGFPVAIRMTRRQVVTAIEDRWRIDDEWWRSEPVARLYFVVLFASGRRLIVFKDLNSGQWYRQEY
jgi:hypothetical protein